MAMQIKFIVAVAVINYGTRLYTKLYLVVLFMIKLLTNKVD